MVDRPIRRAWNILTRVIRTNWGDVYSSFTSLAVPSQKLLPRPSQRRGITRPPILRGRPLFLPVSSPFPQFPHRSLPSETPLCCLLARQQLHDCKSPTCMLSVCRGVERMPATWRFDSAGGKARINGVTKELPPSAALKDRSALLSGARSLQSPLSKRVERILVSLLCWLSY